MWNQLINRTFRLDIFCFIKQHAVFNFIVFNEKTNWIYNRKRFQHNRFIFLIFSLAKVINNKKRRRYQQNKEDFLYSQQIDKDQLFWDHRFIQLVNLSQLSITITYWNKPIKDRLFNIVSNYDWFKYYALFLSLFNRVYKIF